MGTRVTHSVKCPSDGYPKVHPMAIRCDLVGTSQGHYGTSVALNSVTIAIKILEAQNKDAAQDSQVHSRIFHIMRVKFRYES